MNFKSTQASNVKPGDVVVFDRPQTAVKIEEVCPMQTVGWVMLKANGDKWSVALKETDTIRVLQQWEPLAWGALWEAMDDYPTEWIPTTDVMYWNMLECVPPRAQSGHAFLVGEAKRHDDEGDAVHACFKQVGSSYFAKYMTTDEFRMGV